jgi:hypothetical protein
MMRLLEFLEMLALIIGVAFTLLVILPFGLAWIVARLVGL